MSLLDEGTWSDEPPPARPQRRQPSPWDEVVAAVKERPGHWLKFPGKSRNKPYHLRTRYPGLIAEGHHPYVDERGSRRCEVWVQWPAELAEEATE